jgi:HPr kinase/phosphorylase
MAKKHNVTILRSAEATSTIISTIITYLKASLAPRITRHGVLMEIYGEGILLIGDSGIGKSEAAVELLKRGHRLIADDAVEIKKVSNSSLLGTAPELIRNYIELRGIGIINVAKLFGIGAIKQDNEINLVVNIVPWKTHEVYDRLGLEQQYTDILGVQIPMNTIPITPGRNLAVILEVAAMNNRQRRMGYNAALEFTEQINRHFDESMGNL